MSANAAAGQPCIHHWLLAPRAATSDFEARCGRCGIKRIVDAVAAATLGETGIVGPDLERARPTTYADSPKTDAEIARLVKAAQRGLRWAEEDLGRFTWVTLYGQAKRWARTREEAEDFVQEACTNAFRALRSFKPRHDKSYVAWVSTIQRRVIFGRRRTEARGPGVVGDPPVDIPDDADVEIELADDRVFDEQVLPVLEEAIASLRPALRRLADLIRQGNSEREIAVLLGKKLESVQQDMSRLRTAIRAYIQQHFPDLPTAN